MPLSRRRALGLAAAAGPELLAPGRAAAEARAAVLRGGLWQARVAADMPEPGADVHLLSRAAYGPARADRDRLEAIGAEAWLAEQLAPASLADAAVTAELGTFATLGLSGAELLGQDNAGAIAQDLQGATLLRMVYSTRRVLEAMVEFWSDHFSIDIREKYARYLKTVDDREVIRPGALGQFRDLLRASAVSPAMLSYLDNDVNTKNRPNENYAREIMELHSLGVAVDGRPYGEADVLELARCLTGWTFNVRPRGDMPAGVFYFNAGQHDKGAKTVLGQALPANLGQQEAWLVIDHLAGHAATRAFVAEKLVRRFVGDEPGRDCPGLVTRAAAAWGQDGDVKAMLTVILTSPEFGASFGRFGGKVTRPLDHAVRMLRVLGWPMDQFQATARGLILGGRGMLAAAGQRPFSWPTPDGFPDRREAWVASAPMLERWNLALALCGAGEGSKPKFLPAAQTPPDLDTAGAVADHWIDACLGRPMRDADRATVVDFLTAGGAASDRMSAASRERIGATIALILCSPYFLWR